MHVTTSWPTTVARTGIAPSPKVPPHAIGWKRAEDLPLVEYVQIVFTMPAETARTASWHQKAIYGLVFRALAQTVMIIAVDPKRLDATLGITPSCIFGDRR